ncbi:TPA: hypothetical protein MDT80_003654 [Klebsiella pneumoniae]|jgi:hypothetical protein|uniref:hypothetical protein n=1 Tax=Enterobacteriaceae TaxID=543 RepID=UPI000BE4D20F|nr:MULTISPECIES: hypothetical protein [Enterobacteriaceae]EFO2888125.1 hypothetical protein [Escherichia coli]EKT1123649.1 hypothetical protein [Escherichia coli]ELJ8185735.1 hypothetical protein [Escherichia coli]MCA7039823.1 hypothetical protein [Escherichia coli]MCM7803032.1 hypothetical protein [Enterobacter kobei]
MARKLNHLTDEQKKLRTKILTSRRNMIYRVNNDPNYTDVTICDEWLNDPESYYEWHLANMVEGWDIDKDILSGDSKIYSPETCIFTPRDVNLMNRKSCGKSGLMFKGIMKNGTGYCMKTTYNGTNIYGKTHQTQEEAYADYLQFRSERMEEFIVKYSGHEQLCEALKHDTQQCLEQVRSIR